MCMGHLVHQTNITQMCVCAVRQMSLPKGKENGIVQPNNGPPTLPVLGMTDFGMTGMYQCHLY